MEIERVIKVIENEKECISRQIPPICNRDCGRCDLCLPDTEIIQAYDYILNLLKGTNKE